VPYRPRTNTADVVFHVLNRAIRRDRLFESVADYRAFLNVIAQAQGRIPLRILAYCVMPNHFHLVAWPSVEGQLSEFMHWFTATHSKRWHSHRQTAGTGSVYQGRFKAFPVQTDTHFLTVCRYVEQNPLRARLVSKAQDWEWSSLCDRCNNCDHIQLAEWPIPQPDNWLELVNHVESTPVRDIRRAVARSIPYGSESWTKDLGCLFEEPKRHPRS
jgi:putative transposase